MADSGWDDGASSYINGVSVATASNAVSIGAPTVNNGLQIGNDVSVGTWNFTGNIDNLRICNVALSPSQFVY